PCARRTAARLLPRTAQRHAAVPGDREALLLRLGARAPRPLRDDDAPAPEAGRARRSLRLRDRLHPRVDRTSSALAAAAVAGSDGLPLHDPQRRLLLPAAA